MPQAFQQPFVFTNAAIVDVDHGLRPGASIRIDNGRIDEVAFGTSTRLQPQDQVIDLRGRTVMPGMFSCHYHATYALSGTSGPVFPVGMEAPPALQAFRAAYHVGLALDAGFTSLISAGAPWGVDASLKAAIDDGILRGPRIMAGSRDVSTTGHSQDLWLRWYWDIGAHPGVNLCDGPDEFARGIRQEVKRGAEIIKIFLSPGHGVAGVKAKMEMSRAELAAAVEAAHARSVKIRAHVANRDAILEAVELGVDVIDHGDGLDEQCIDLMLEKGAFLVPSMLFTYNRAAMSEPSLADAIKAELDQMLKILPTANKAGVKILLGDDFGAVPIRHGDYADELDFYVNVAGIPSLDVLRWATLNGAELMDKRGELGTMKPGALADLVIVDGDPVANIAVLRQSEKILAVLKDGQFEKNNLHVLDASSQVERAYA